MTRIYGKVENTNDIRRINCIIRDEMLFVEDEQQLTDLKKRSDYLCTLTHSPFWKKKFWSMIEELKEVALEENRITVRTANYVSKFKWFDKQYDAWGKDNETIEEKVENLPKFVLEELGEFAENLDLSYRILDEIRASYCRIRAAMVVAKSEIQLTMLKKQSDAIKSIVYTGEFRARFEKEYDEILELVKVEEAKTVELANIVAAVNDYFVSYDILDEDNLWDIESLEEYLAQLEAEEEKSTKYIPTEAKYRQGIVYWLVYKHPKKDRKYAKRIYFSSYAKDIQIEGPGEFENKFGRKVYWVKITYLTYYPPITIHRKNIEINLPERWVKRTKIIELPKGVEKVELVDTRPDFAYPVA